MKALCWIAVAMACGIAPAAAQTFPSSAGNLSVETIASGLANPWALAFLPDGRMLVTERPGRLRIVARDGKLSPPVAGVPQVRASDRADCTTSCSTASSRGNKTIYFCFAEPASGGGRTAMARARLNDGEAPRLDDVKVIFRQEGPLSGGNHFGCRIVQGRDGNLWLTMGDHFTYRDEAQNLANHLGKIVRVTPDGAVPPDNPFVDRKDAKPEIWSYGHRNSQGAALHPQTGKLWEHEHGPRGGDEINIPLAGKNYGWPVIGYGIDYSGARIHETTAEGRHGAADQVLGAVDRAVRHGVLHRLSASRMERQHVRRRARRTDAGAARTRRREGHQGRATARQSARAHPRRTARAGRRALAADRQRQRQAAARDAGEVSRARRRCDRPRV